MHCITAAKTLRKKYGKDSGRIVAAIERLGDVIDVSGLDAAAIRAKIAALPAKQGAVLIGGYAVVPAFNRPNPTAHLDSDDDRDIMTDAPYGAAADDVAAEYAPDRIVARIPDGAARDAGKFLAVLDAVRSSARTRTPAGIFEEAADEFEGAAGVVHRFLFSKRGGASPALSPPSQLARPDPVPLLSGKGRVHFLLHGADSAPDWAFLWGHADRAKTYTKAFSAATIGKCDLRGSVVTFSSCYSAMLDGSRRNAANQVALACLASGAKVVVGSTRSNWIPTMAPFTGLGPGLVASFWKELHKPGRTAGEAFVRAKKSFLKTALAGDRADRPYILKTVLQAQLYGNPEARL